MTFNRSNSFNCLNYDELLIVQAIIKEVEGHHVEIDEIITFQAHHLEVDGETVSTVLIKTTYALYSLGRDYFKQLVKKYKAIAVEAVEVAVQQEAEAVRQQKADEEAALEEIAEEIAEEAADNDGAIQQLVTPSQEKLTACPHCTDGCGHCNYRSLKPEPQPDPLGLTPLVSPHEFRYQLHLPNIYSVYLMGECLGFIQRVRNLECVIENNEDTWLWFANGMCFTNPTDTADALLTVIVSLPIAA
ncbi:MAG: hypothetical protein F6K31_25710 [Symploca sp. SIO2G7]|nr:hypothetical protein [Symploca sp. SIO2G7]